MTSELQELEGPHFNTAGWEKDFNGCHPVEMLARIAKFEGKEEAKYEPHRRNVRNPGGHDTRKVVCCSYDNFKVLGNGKLEKQAKMVSARNMIVKIKTVNIGIVNETLAAGVTLDPCVDPKPHKKPLVRQFKSFTSGGTLGSSFVAAATSSSSEGKPKDIVTPPVCSVKDTDNIEIEQYKAYLDGKIETPTEKLPPNDSDAISQSSPAPEPKIVFKRSADTDTQYTSEPDNKKSKTENEPSQEAETSSSDSQHQDWNPSNYGYHCNNSESRGRGRGGWRGYNRGYNNRGRGWGGGGYGANNYGGYGYGGGGGYGYGGGGGYNYGYGGWQQ